MENENELKAEEIKKFKEDNETDLINEFVESHKEDFEIFLKNEIIDEIYHIDYWKKVFCEEDFKDYFDEYVNKCYSENIENGN